MPDQVSINVIAARDAVYDAIDSMGHGIAAYSKNSDGTIYIMLDYGAEFILRFEESED